jgi:uncharacterized membrane-anchored protein
MAMSSAEIQKIEKAISLIWAFSKLASLKQYVSHFERKSLEYAANNQQNHEPVSLWLSSCVFDGVCIADRFGAATRACCADRAFK